MSAQESAFEVASLLTGKKERAIENALDHVFGEGKWEEETVKDACWLQVKDDKSEVFYINNLPMVYFGPIETDITITHNSALATYKQTIKDLYK